MAVRDTNLVFSNGQAITDDAIGDGFIDIEQYLSVDQQEKLFLNIRCVAKSAASALANGMDILLISTDDASYTGDPTIAVDDVVVGVRLALADIVVGKCWSIAALVDNLKKYLFLYYDCKNNAPNASITFDAELGNDFQTNLKTQKMPT